MSTHLNPSEKKILTLAALGGMLEFYDFIIYGIFSIYFAHQFFPNNNPLLSILESYVVFILGYIARPFGGLIFSHIGDEHGRKKVLMITIVLMGGSSLGIGLLPTFAQIGIIAPLALLILRLLQGVALGGELPTTYVYVRESLADKQGRSFGITMLGVNSGLLIGMIINFILNHLLTPDELSEFGWRLPFIFGGALCFLSYYIRKSLHETAEFINLQKKTHFPLIHLLKNYRAELFTGIAITAIMAALVVVAIVFMPTYLNKLLHFDNKTTSYAMAFCMVCNIIMIYCTGRITEKISPIKILAFMLLVNLPIIPLSYYLINVTHYWLVGLALLASVQGTTAMLIPLLISSLFPAHIRLTGVALCYNLGFTFFGGLAPVIITAAINSGLSVTLTPIIYLLMVVILTAWGVRRYSIN